MGAIDDYLNSLEGQENLDASKVAKDLFDLHKQEIGTREAKITELNGAVAERDGKLVEVNDELTRQKARNFDLSLSIPGNAEKDKPRNEDEKPTGDQIRVSDLFNKSIRAKHFKNER